AVRKDQVRSQQRLAVADVIARASIDLVEILKRARCVVECPLCPWSGCMSSQILESRLYICGSFPGFGDPDWCALAGRNIRLLSRAHLENAMLCIESGLVESPNIIHASSYVRLADPHEVRRHAARHDENGEEHDAYRETFHASSGRDDVTLL